MKEEQRQVRMTIGGDQVDYPGDYATKGADLVTTKCLFDSVISTDGAKFMNLVVKDFYLDTILPTKEYIQILALIIPKKSSHTTCKISSTKDTFTKKSAKACMDSHKQEELQMTNSYPA
jgi:hypothetical protein